MKNWEKNISLHTLICLVWRQEGHLVSKNKSLQTTPNNESQDLIGGNHPTHASMEKRM